jgi:hypothetical protein
MAIPLEIEAKILLAAAETARSSKQYEEAIDLYKKSMTSLELIHGKKSMDVAVVCMDIGEVCEESGDRSESEKFFTRMRKIVEYQKDQARKTIIDDSMCVNNSYAAAWETDELRQLLISN